MSTPDEPTTESATPADASNGDEDVRARFRAALDRKQSQQGRSGAAPRTGPGQAHTAAAKPTRRFQRKSG